MPEVPTIRPFRGFANICTEGYCRVRDRRRIEFGRRPPRAIQRAGLGRFARLAWRNSANRLTISWLRPPTLPTYKVRTLNIGTDRLVLGRETLPRAQL